MPDIYDPYPAYEPNNLLENARVNGIFYSWQQRAVQYCKDPIGTWQSTDPNKINWTVKDVIKDPVGMLVGRDYPSEEEIEAHLIEQDRSRLAVSITKASNYYMVTGHNSVSNGYDVPRADDLEKTITTCQMYVDMRRNEEVEGELMFEKRLNWDWNFILHRISLGLYRWDPHATKTAVPGRYGYGTGELIRQKPVRGPNIRGRYARDLRGDHDVLYEFTNLNDASNLGSDNGGVQAAVA